jgi:hypothetical protein
LPDSKRLIDLIAGIKSIGIRIRIIKLASKRTVNSNVVGGGLVKIKSIFAFMVSQTDIERY